MNKIPVFYTARMCADSKSASPSAAKPTQVVASWQRQFPVEILEPEPVTVDQLCLAHDRQFVEEILACKRANGFGNMLPEVAASLVYTSGSMLSAARHAIAKRSVAAAPCSGFHHAGFSKAQGFCTFNGLMVTALALMESGVSRIGILDLDMHYGNGTDNVLRKLKLEGLSKLGAEVFKHFTAGKTYLDAYQADEFLYQRLPAELAWMSDCDIVLYQAGADPHIDDPHGGWLTTEQLHERDRMVFERLASYGVPVAWNLAGGYQVEKDGTIPKVLEIHDNTMRACADVYLDSPLGRRVAFAGASRG